MVLPKMDVNQLSDAGTEAGNLLAQLVDFHVEVVDEGFLAQLADVLVEVVDQHLAQGVSDHIQ